MITVCFYGGLREYGRRFHLHAATPAEALHALFTQIKGLREHIRNGVYQVRFNGKDQTEAGIADNFRQPAGGVLHIVPRVAGAGKNGGIIQTVVGAIMVVVGYLFSWTGVGAIVGNLGLAMMMGGIAQMLTKQPSLDTNSSGVESSKNTSFSNLSNTAAQGQPVALAYGLVYCGSRVVSQGVETRRISTGTGSAAADTGSSVVKQVAAAAGIQADGSDPLAVDLTLGMQKTYIAGTAATAPNGEIYQTDFADDSVRARNYTAAFKVEK